jgi:WD40 repeat protein
VAGVASANTAGVWDVDTGDHLAELHTPGTVLGVTAAPLPDGRLLLALGCRDGALQLWTSTAPLVTPHDPPLDDRRPVTGPWTVSRLTDRTFSALAAEQMNASSMKAIVTDDGRTLIAVGEYTGQVGVWEAESGSVVGRLDFGDRRAAESLSLEARTVAWSPPDSGHPRLAVATYGDGFLADVWSPDHQHALPLAGHTAVVQSVAWSPAGAGDVEVASGSVDRTAAIWNPDTGERRLLLDAGDPVFTVAWTLVAGSGRELATAGGNGVVRLWDADSGAHKRDLHGHDSYIHFAEYVTLPDGRVLLGTASSDHTVRIWDPTTAECLHVLDHGSERAWSLSWAVLADGRVLLATCGVADTIHLWDGVTGEHLHNAAEPTSVRSVALYQPADGRVMLASAGSDGVRLHEIHLVPPVAVRRPAPGAPPDRTLTTRTDGLIALGSGGMWLPFGLVADLVTLTGLAAATDTLHDARLRPLAAHPGLARLRALGWRPDARVALAALLAVRLPVDPRYTPPPRTGPTDQHTALARALDSPGTTPIGTADLTALRAAADRVTPDTTTLLGIVGEDAATLDPLLPLRLAHHAPALPELSPVQRTLVAGTALASRPRSNAAATAHAPGSVGVTRSGPLPTVLLTEHAHPAEIFRLRYAANQLLHRHHPAVAMPPARPVTLVLDTTPPTFGAPEALLRLAAHLVTHTLWATDRRPLLVTLTEPGTVRELASPADLLTVWTSRTLGPPDLAAALHTATTATPHPTVTLTTHHGAAAHPPVSAQRQLLTTHHPGHEPRHTPTAAHHHHLPPDAAPAAITAVVAAALDAAGGAP